MGRVSVSFFFVSLPFWRFRYPAQLVLSERLRKNPRPQIVVLVPEVREGFAGFLGLVFRFLHRAIVAPQPLPESLHDENAEPATREVDERDRDCGIQNSRSLYALMDSSLLYGGPAIRTSRMT